MPSMESAVSSFSSVSDVSPSSSLDDSQKAEASLQRLSRRPLGGRKAAGMLPIAVALIAIFTVAFLVTSCALRLHPSSKTAATRRLSDDDSPFTKFTLLKTCDDDDEGAAGPPSVGEPMEAGASDEQGLYSFSRIEGEEARNTLKRVLRSFSMTNTEHTARVMMRFETQIWGIRVTIVMREEIIHKGWPKAADVRAAGASLEEALLRIRQQLIETIPHPSIVTEVVDVQPRSASSGTAPATTFTIQAWWSPLFKPGGSPF